VRRSVLITLCVVLTGLGLVAQDQVGRNEVKDFTAGLVTAKNPLTQRFDEATKAWNVDFTRNRLELGPRLGYSERARLPLVDSFLWNGINVARYRDGTKEFLAIGKWDDSAWAGIFVSDPNEFGFGVVDSTIVRPDTAEIRDSVQAHSRTTFELWFRITVAGNSWNVGGESFDTGAAPSLIVDSFVAHINNSGAASYVTAYDLGDSLSVKEDDPDYVMALAGWGSTPYWPYSYHPTEGTLASLGTCWTMRNIDNAIDSASVLTSRFPATGMVHQSQFRDQVYISTDVGVGRMYYKGMYVDWPIRAPGVPSILPLTTAGKVNGIVRYALKFGGPEYDSGQVNLGHVLGPLSPEIRVDSGQVRLYDWPVPNADGWHGDSLYVEIWRSLGDVGTIGVEDYLYRVDSVLIHANAGTVQYTDTTSDVTLHSRDSIAAQPSWNDSTWGSGCYYAPDTTDGSRVERKRMVTAPGAPTILGPQMVTAPGIWKTDSVTVDWSDVLGWALMVVRVDTSFHRYGDSSRTCWFWQPFQPDTNSIGVFSRSATDTLNTGFGRLTWAGLKIVIPDDGLSPRSRYDLYRAPIIPVALDSTRVLRLKRAWKYTDEARFEWTYTAWEYSRFATEVETPAFYFLGNYGPGDTVIDSLSYDSLLARDIWRRDATPPLIRDMVITNNRLIAIDDRAAYMGEPADSLLRFSILEQRPVNPDDGDQLTGIIAASQGVARLMKNFSTFSLFRSGGLWQTPELSAFYGMVAPLSKATAPEGVYFLSADGVRLESEGIYKDRSFTARKISAPLANFDHLDMAIKRNAIGIAHDNKYILSFPSLDTSFVLNKIDRGDGTVSFAWSQWSLCPVGATKYRVSDDNMIIPGDTLYFILSGDSRIYSWGNSEFDNASDIYWEWQSGPSNPVSGNLWYPEDIAFYLQSDEPGIMPYTVALTSDRGTIHGFLMNRLDTANWHQFDASDSTGEQGALYWYLKIYRNLNFHDSGTTSIQGLWFNVSPKERYGSQ